MEAQNPNVKRPSCIFAFRSAKVLPPRGHLTPRDASAGAIAVTTGTARFGFSLIEMLLVVAIVGIMAAMISPYANSSAADRLVDAGYVVAADLQYARQLAVSNSSKYKLTFAANASIYSLTHSGTNTSLNTLPSPAFRASSDTATSKNTDFIEMPGLESVRIYNVYQRATAARTATTAVEFDSLGATTSTLTTEVWLVANTGSEQRYLSISVHPATGLADVGTVTGTPPSLVIP